MPPRGADGPADARVPRAPSPRGRGLSHGGTLPCGLDRESDDVLWRRHLEGDGAAWLELVRRHHGAVRRFFVNKASEACDDLTQTTLARVQASRTAFEGRATLRAFILGFARNVLREYIRAAKRDAALDLDDVTAQALQPSPSSLLGHRAEQRLVLAALRQLSLAHQVVLELFYWEDLTDVEIAEVLDISHNTVRSRITRARDRMREVLAAMATQDPLAAESVSADAFERWARDVREQVQLEDDRA